MTNHADDAEDRIDLSALDPTRDRERWNGMVASLTERAIARSLARRSVAGQLTAWARPTLAFAAALSLLVWVGALREQTSAKQDAIDLLSNWASQGELPATPNILETFNGATDGSR
jgi:hypothetical protein